MTKKDVLLALFVLIVILAVAAHFLYPKKPTAAEVLKLDSRTLNGPGMPPPIAQKAAK